nr:U28_MYRTX_Sd1a [Stenamma debile]
MRLSYLSLAFAIIFVMAIIYAPGAEAKALSEADAFGEAEPQFPMDMLIAGAKKLFSGKK